MIPIFRNLSAPRANEYAMVLASADIPHQLILTRTGWTLLVDGEQGPAATGLIVQYLGENAPPAAPMVIQPCAHASAWSGMWGALILAVIHLAIVLEGDPASFFHVYGASADRILDGELFRCVTALLLHADIRHLFGNLAGIVVFGTAVCWRAGWGLGWAMILFSGIFGNAVNAFFYQTRHLSVGASTAIFGAVGILSTCALIPGIRQGEKPLRAFLPLGAGLALLAFLGAGRYTDLPAHLFGFISGMIIGGIFSIVRQYVSSPGMQVFALFLTVAILAGSWIAGLMS